MKKKTRPTRSRVVYGDQATPSPLRPQLRPHCQKGGASPLTRPAPSVTELGPRPQKRIMRSRPTVAASHPQCSRRRCTRSYLQHTCYRRSGASTASVEWFAENSVVRSGNSTGVLVPLCTRGARQTSTQDRLTPCACHAGEGGWDEARSAVLRLGGNPPCNGYSADAVDRAGSDRAAKPWAARPHHWLSAPLMFMYLQASLGAMQKETIPCR